LKKGGKTVYFGDLGENATTLINYFQRNGARQIEAQENVAEYMLDVIGAGATATSEIEWHGKWLEAPESKSVQVEIERIHTEGRQKPVVEGTFQLSR
jgi:ATP-binding cassette, subfamily G (WHITE), member 2, SNQ2